MKAVSIKELKNRLSAYLREVKSGEVVLVTDRGNVVAELRQPTAGTVTTPFEQELERLAAQGAVTLGLPHDPSVYRPSPLPEPVEWRDLLDQERGES